MRLSFTDRNQTRMWHVSHQKQTDQNRMHPLALMYLYKRHWSPKTQKVS